VPTLHALLHARVARRTVERGWSDKRAEDSFFAGLGLDIALARLPVKKAAASEHAPFGAGPVAGTTSA
jgi:hypothetical protein